MAGVSVIQAGEESSPTSTPAKKVAPAAKPVRKRGGPKQTKK
jgi:hypothetical protein